jgi:hypothetical protein
MSRGGKRIALNGPDGPILSRRVLLSGSLAGVTALCAVPTRVEAQYSGGGGTPSGAGAASGTSGGAAAGSKSGAAAGGTGQAKEAKTAARYQDKPNGAQQCGRCTHYRSPNACQIVEGSISPSGWCGHFKPTG